jgi:6-phosphogluconolactonase/glucosamine-6-phosphate isomerase/deaminase
LNLEVNSLLVFLVSNNSPIISLQHKNVFDNTGGSLGKYLCTILPKIKTDWSKWLIFFCDERFVPENDSESTFG